MGAPNSPWTPQGIDKKSVARLDDYLKGDSTRKLDYTKFGARANALDETDYTANMRKTAIEAAKKTFGASYTENDRGYSSDNFMDARQLGEDLSRQKAFNAQVSAQMKTIDEQIQNQRDLLASDAKLEALKAAPGILDARNAQSDLQKSNRRVATSNRLSGRAPAILSAPLGGSVGSTILGG